MMTGSFAITHLGPAIVHRADDGRNFAAARKSWATLAKIEP